MMAPSSLLETLRAGGDPYGALAAQRDSLARLEAVAEAYAERGEHEDAVGTADAAAALAELNHPGVLVSPRLEDLLSRISREHLPLVPAAVKPPAPELVRPAGDRERVLIVATETYASGGHTRVVWRWIARDPSRTYSLASTAQRGVLPDGLRAAVAMSGGQVLEIPADAPALLRAATLRELAREADLLVLMDHPYDPVPMLAFAGMPVRPPIVMFNHGDHLFWLGREIVDVLMCIRPEGVACAARRGFPATRVIETPFPVFGADGNGREASRPVDPVVRAQARKRLLHSLDWPAEAVLLVTVGSYHKWEGPPGQRLLDLIEPVLAAHPEARLVAAGTNGSDHWREMARRTGGRIAAVGVLAGGVGELLSAGDIFLDSRPIGGMAAPAEAAAHGLPVLSGGATELERSVLGFEEVYGGTCVIGNDAYRETLARWIADPELRSRVGERARETLAAADAGWEDSVERTFALARRLGPIDPGELGPLPAPEERDVLVDYMSSYRGKSAQVLAANVTVRELICANPPLRRLYGSLEHTTFRQIARFPAAFAAPSADAAALRAVVGQLRILSQLGLTERCVIALAPEVADAAIPTLEAAIAEGADFDLELTVEPEPARAKPANALVLA